MNVAKKPAARSQPKQGKVVKLDRQMCSLRFSPCGKFLVAGGTDATVRRWDFTTATLAALPSLLGHNGWVQALAFHPDWKRLFTADSWGELRCWPHTERQPKPLWAVKAAHNGWVRDLAVSPDGAVLASCGTDARVCLWSAGGKKLRELKTTGADTFAVAFHPNSKTVVAGDLKGVVRQWDVATGKSVRDLDARLLYRFERLQDVGGVRRLAFDAAGTTLACAGGQPKSGGFVQAIPTLLLFDWQTGKVKQTLKLGAQSEGFVYDLHWHLDGSVMGVTSGQPGAGKLFFQRPGEAAPYFQTKKMANCHALAVHPDGRRLVVAATNGNSSGNGRLVGKNKEYPGNFSPLFVWDLPKPVPR